MEVCPFRIIAGKEEFLLLRRAGGDPLYPGIWQFVTGRLEGSESAGDAALRELREETGLSPAHFWVVPHVNAFYDPVGDTVNMVPLFAAEIAPGAAVSLSAEHTGFLWLPYEKALRVLVWPAQRACLAIVRQYIIGEEPARGLLSLF